MPARCRRGGAQADGLLWLHGSANDLGVQAQPAETRAWREGVKPEDPLDVPALTRRMAEGNETAFRIFYGAYFDRLWRYLLVVAAGDEQASREALQATMLRVVRYIKVFPSEAALWGWLTVLARSALADQTRKQRRYLAFLDRFSRHTRVQQTGVDEAESDATLLALLDKRLAELPADERELVEAKYFARRSVRELADQLQTSEKAIESRLVRIRRKLRDTLLGSLKDE
jgi:RNA polymerase sigma-70 factor, ECF subfamily